MISFSFYYFKFFLLLTYFSFFEKKKKNKKDVLIYGAKKNSPETAKLQSLVPFNRTDILPSILEKLLATALDATKGD